jgi:DNA topoisomerase VI subunit A
VPINEEKVIAMRRTKRTLFTPDYSCHFSGKFRARNVLYTAAIDLLYEPPDQRFAGSETDIFHAIISYERQYYEDLSHAIAGPITIYRNHRSIDLRKSKRHFLLPSWVESDALNFRLHKTQGILIVEKWIVFKKLLKSREFQNLNLVMVACNGIPKAPTRRVIHRLSEENSLPVYVLADNDTWGYYIFSVLKRGLMGPHSKLPYLAVPRARFLGMCAGDLKRFNLDEDFLKIKRGREYWKLRLREMRKYPCFKSRKWQSEFDAFERQDGKYEVEALLWNLGADRFIREYIRPRIQNLKWLA